MEQRLAFRNDIFTGRAAQAIRSRAQRIHHGKGIGNPRFKQHRAPPLIAVAVVLEYGSAGEYSLNVAKDIFDAYFYGKVLDEDGNLVTPGIADSAGGLRTGAENA